MTDGFTHDMVVATGVHISKAQKLRLEALSSEGWLTSAEIGSGAGMALTLLCTAWDIPLAERKWTTWPGGEGYEYRRTPQGDAVLAFMKDSK